LRRVNPLIQALSLIVAAALLGLAFLIGAVVIGVLLAVGAVAALTIAIRIWWLQRKIRAGTAGNPSGRSAQQVIEGDYTVVSETDAKPGRPRSVARDDAQSHPRDSAD
jgi:predicted lipid-binding transport protein (Tim44 family)